MWSLENETSFAAERTWVRDRDGAEVWVVAVKGTYTLTPGGVTSLAEEQEEVLRAPVYWGEPGRSSLRYDADLILTKPTTDILLHGHAYPPGGRPAPQVDVTLRVGDVTKTLRVFGDRTWRKTALGLTLSAPKPFERMPIVYERAFGGIDLRPGEPQPQAWEPGNPIGVGFATSPNHLAEQPAPNIEDPRASMTHWKQRPRPSGFGPIPRDWSPRLGYAGTYDDRWEQARRPLLPLDFDDRHYQCAPEDQQSAQPLRGGEPVELRNLTSAGVLRFELPRIFLGFTTEIGDEVRYHKASLHTVLLEPDALRLIMTWQTALPCHQVVYKLLTTRIYEKERL
ncbi:DUF2169 domain-containing protein [soil metagenome]